MNTHQTINIIADNGGGITLQILGGESNYQKYFESAKLAAQPVFDAITAKEGDCADDIGLGWDGNDLEDEDVDLLTPSHEEEKSGGYWVLENALSFHEVIEWGVNSAWHNIIELSDLIHELVNE